MNYTYTVWRNGEMVRESAEDYVAKIMEPIPPDQQSKMHTCVQNLEEVITAIADGAIDQKYVDFHAIRHDIRWLKNSLMGPFPQPIGEPIGEPRP